MILKGIIFTVLTALTQIGGIAYAVASLAWSAQRRRHIPTALTRFLVPATAITLYAVMTAFVAPPLAAHWGRQRLPCTQGETLVPATRLTCWLNRGYVSSETLTLLSDLGHDLSRRFPGSRLGVLEGGFPFIDGFPLVPHLSHRDGRKVDLSFFYLDENGNPRPDGSPSTLGYFVYVQPTATDTQPCRNRFTPLRWDFAWLQTDAPNWPMDAQRTQWMVHWLKNRPEVVRLFLEPHLAERLGENGGKLRFQGCQAARHDDHLHVQTR
ncbi:MAG: hypothetical protein AB7G62_05815 [Magnetospirillum sp.]